MRLAPWLFSLTIASAVLVLSGCGDSAPDPTYASRDGETLLARGNCTACHAANETVRDRIRSLPGPRLIGNDGAGSRLSPDFIRRFLNDPHAAKPGTRMPHVLHGLADDAKAETIENLLAYLRSQRPDGWVEPQPSNVLPEDIRHGEQLHRTIGCAVCHAEPDLQRLAQWTDLASMVAFLKDPLHSHPAGLMPSMGLTDEEARSLAAYLLQNQAKGPDGSLITTRSPGLRAEYTERPMADRGIPDDDHNATRLFVWPAINIDFDRREDEWAIRFQGSIDIPSDGEYEFFLGSDDGSKLWLDDALAIDNGGLHGVLWKSKRLTLSKGLHPFHLLMWEILGGNELKLEWIGPGFKRQPIPADRFVHESLLLVPSKQDAVADSARAVRGKELFASLGCANCHVAPSSKGPAFAELRPDRGCLAETPTSDAPDFGLNATTRASLRDVVTHARDLTLTLSPKRSVEHAMSRIGCVQCHQRDGVGGPTALTGALFTSSGSAELGDQGRLPPRLDEVGDKLRPETLAKVLGEGEKVRPYMLTRMPIFGSEATRGVAASFTAADRIAAHDAEPTFTPESVQVGRQLVGSTGVSCITCHTVNGRASLGVPAVDLGIMHRRLRPGWFLAFLENPIAFTPGTRMTRFWLPNERIFQTLLNGDPQRQREAIWNYLSLGEAMPLPAGLVAKSGEWEVIPAADPVVFGTFMRDVSPRTICVGFPELVHVAYDAQHARLAKAWRGKFMDSAGTWEGRAGQLSEPGGSSTINMPDGDAVAILASRETPWPAPSLVFKGMERDGTRVPSFASQLPSEVGGHRVREQMVPVLSSGGARLRRTIESWADEDRTDMFARIAVGASISGDGLSFNVDGRMTIVLESKGAFVRTIDGLGGPTKELLVPVDFKYVEGETPRYRATVRFDIAW